MEIPITKNERDSIEPHLSEFIKFIGMLPEYARAYIYMEFTKRNMSEMQRLLKKYGKETE